MISWIPHLLNQYFLYLRESLPLSDSLQISIYLIHNFDELISLPVCLIIWTWFLHQHCFWMVRFLCWRTWHVWAYIIWFWHCLLHLNEQSYCYSFPLMFDLLTRLCLMLILIIKYSILLYLIFHLCFDLGFMITQMLLLFD